MEKKPSKWDRVIVAGKTKAKELKEEFKKDMREYDKLSLKEKVERDTPMMMGMLGPGGVGGLGKAIKVSGKAAGELGNISKQFARVKHIAGKGKSKIIDRSSKFIREHVTDLKHKDSMRTQMEKMGISKDAIKEEFTSRGKPVKEKIAGKYGVKPNPKTAVKREEWMKKGERSRIEKKNKIAAEYKSKGNVQLKSTKGIHAGENVDVDTRGKDSSGLMLDFHDRESKAIVGKMDKATGKERKLYNQISERYGNNEGEYWDDTGEAVRARILKVQKRFDKSKGRVSK